VRFSFFIVLFQPIDARCRMRPMDKHEGSMTVAKVKETVLSHIMSISDAGEAHRWAQCYTELVTAESVDVPGARATTSAEVRTFDELVRAHRARMRAYEAIAAAPKRPATPCLPTPIFEVIKGGNHFAIYANGDVEGFGDSPYVTNRIPLLIAGLRAVHSKSLHVEGCPCMSDSPALGGLLQGSPRNPAITQAQASAAIGEK
jgi:hypothetical protein